MWIEDFNRLQAKQSEEMSNRRKMQKGEEENTARLDEWENLGDNSGDDSGEEEGNSIRPNEWRNPNDWEDSDEDSEEEGKIIAY